MLTLQRKLTNTKQYVVFKIYLNTSYGVKKLAMTLHKAQVSL